MTLRKQKGNIWNARCARTPAGDLDLAAERAIAACGGDAQQTVKTLLVAVDFLEAQAAELRAAASTCYSRGRYDVQRDRKE